MSKDSVKERRLQAYIKIKRYLYTIGDDAKLFREMVREEIKVTETFAQGVANGLDATD